MRHESSKRKQQGFSLVELMVSIVVMAIVSGAVMSLMRDSIKVATATYELTDAQQSLRTAQEYLNRDLMNAGDGLSSIGNIAVPQGFVTNYLTLNPITDPSTPGVIRLPLLTSDNNVPANTIVLGTDPVVTVRSSPVLTDRQTILAIDSTFTPIALTASAITPSGTNVSISPVDAGRFNVGEIYFLTSSVGATFGTITNITNPIGLNPNLIFASGDTLGLNIPGNGGQINTVSAKGTIPTSLMRMRIIHYYTDSNGRLMRRVFGVKGAGFTEGAIAEHVISVQFLYSLDLRDNNGNVVQPVAQLISSQQQVSVRQVEVTVTVETAHALHNGTKQQLTMNTATSVRNMQFRQAIR